MVFHFHIPELTIMIADAAAAAAAAAAATYEEIVACDLRLDNN